MGFGDVGRWTAADGARLALRHAPAAGTRRGAVILLHGWGDHGGLLAETAEWFAARGVDAFALDQRGAGQSPGTRGHVERFAQFLADVQNLRKHVAAVAPGPQLLLGHSYGGFVTLRYLETSPLDLAGAIVLAPFVWFAEPPAGWKVALARLLADVAPRFRIPTGLDYARRSRDPAVHARLRHDPDCHSVMTPRAWQETMVALGALGSERERITVPLLALLAGEDFIVSTAAARRFLDTLSGDLTVVELDGLYHDLIHEPERARVFDAIAPWLERRLGG